MRVAPFRAFFERGLPQRGSESMKPGIFLSPTGVFREALVFATLFTLAMALLDHFFLGGFGPVLGYVFLFFAAAIMYATLLFLLQAFIGRREQARPKE